MGRALATLEGAPRQRPAPRSASSQVSALEPTPCTARPADSGTWRPTAQSAGWQTAARAARAHERHAGALARSGGRAAHGMHARVAHTDRSYLAQSCRVSSPRHVFAHEETSRNSRALGCSCCSFASVAVSARLSVYHPSIIRPLGKLHVRGEPSAHLAKAHGGGVRGRIVRAGVVSIQCRRGRCAEQPLRSARRERAQCAAGQKEKCRMVRQAGFRRLGPRVRWAHAPARGARTLRDSARRRLAIYRDRHRAPSVRPSGTRGSPPPAVAAPATPPCLQLQSCPR